VRPKILGLRAPLDDSAMKLVESVVYSCKQNGHIAHMFFAVCTFCSIVSVRHILRFMLKLLNNEKAKVEDKNANYIIPQREWNGAEVR